MDQLQLKLCDIQGRLFELSGKAGYSSPEFIRAFMTSNTAAGLDSSYNRLQWAGEEYLLEDVSETNNLPKGGDVYPGDALYWIGYLYRFWHFYKNADSRNIVRTAPPQTMKRNYTMFHSIESELAVDDLIEIYEQKRQQAE